MIKGKMKLLGLVGLLGLSLTACATPAAPYDYTKFRAEAPRSILVVPALNGTAEVTAPDWFLSTVAAPFAERGYYVFPANMVRGALNESGLSDAGLVHSVDARRLQPLFGCDSVLFISITKWNSKYLVLATSTEVALEYKLQSCKTNETLWADKQEFTYTPQSSGGGIGGLIAQAVVSAIEKAKPSYMPLARQANLAASTTPGHGLPAGPYRPNEVGKDVKLYPASVK